MAGARDALSRSIRTAEILAVGSELLTPHRIDTNSLFLTERLNGLGIDVAMKSVVPDDLDLLRARLLQAIERADLVVTTGGLGPTSDDLTREAVAGALGVSLVEDAELVARIRQRFERRGIPMPASNLRQAQVPAGARVLLNPNGTAPGLWIDRGDRILLVLPGPPREMQPMFDAAVPDLRARAAGRLLKRRVIKIAGRPESAVEDIANPIYLPLASAAVPIETTILASPGLIELHLSTRGDNAAAMDASLEAATQALANALAPAAFSTDGRSLEEVVGALVLGRGWRLATAESCTGGLIGARLTDVPGSSGWFSGGVVAYDNRVKTGLLGVPASMIDEHGAGSEPVARAMAEGARKSLDAQVAIAVTGIAGPTGGTAAKPVGTVVIAVATPTGTEARTHRLGGDRTLVRQHAAVLALDAVRHVLLT